MSSKNCDNCWYRRSFTSGSLPYCNYIFMTGHKRPCPPGDACTEKITRRMYRKRKRTPEEIAAAVEKRRAREREKSKAYYEKHKDEINAKAKAKRLAKCNG